MAQSIPTARIPTPGHLSGICLLEKKFVATGPWWGQHIYTNPHGGASGRGQIHCSRPDGTRSKFDLMIEAKNILIGSSGFLEH